MGRTVEQTLAILRETPRHIAATTGGVAPAQLRATPVDDGWSANEVLAHLRACADVWGGCIAAMLAEDTPTLVAVGPRTWIDQTDYVDRAFRPSLREFTSQRRSLLAVLEPLGPDGWSRSAVVTGAGRPLTKTVLDYAERLAGHERSHLRQIEGIVRTSTRALGRSVT